MQVVVVVQNSVSSVMQQSMSSMMQAAEVMHVAEMTACPVGDIEMMADGGMAYCTVTHAAMSDSNMPSARMTQTSVPGAAMTDACMASTNM